MRRPFNRDRRPFPVYNNSGEAIPPYACMELDYNYESGKSAIEVINQEPVLWVKKPTSTAAADPSIVVFNSENAIPITGYGSAQIDPFVLALWDGTPGSPDPGDAVGPVASSWKISTDGSGFTVKTFDSADAINESSTERTIYVEKTGGGGEIQAFVTPAGGIAARSGSTLGSATCTMLSLTGGTRSTGGTATVYNDFTSAVGGSVDIIAAKIDGIWVVIAEDCA